MGSIHDPVNPLPYLSSFSLFMMYHSRIVSYCIIAVCNIFTIDTRRKIPPRIDWSVINVDTTIVGSNLPYTKAVKKQAKKREYKYEAQNRSLDRN